MGDLKRSLRLLNDILTEEERDQCLRVVLDHYKNFSDADEFLELILDGNEGALKIVKGNFYEAHLKTVCKKLLEIIDGIVKSRHKSLSKVQVDNILDMCRDVFRGEQLHLKQLCSSIICNLGERLYYSDITNLIRCILDERRNLMKETFFLEVLGVLFEHCPNQTQEARSKQMWEFLVCKFSDLSDKKEISIFVECFVRLLKNFPLPENVSIRFYIALTKLIEKSSIHNEGSYYKSYLILFEKSLESICDLIHVDQFQRFQQSFFDQLDKQDSVTLESPLLRACEKLHEVCLKGAKSDYVYRMVWNHLWDRLSKNILKVYDAKCLTHFTRKPLRLSIRPEVSKLCRILTVSCTHLSKMKDEESCIMFCFYLESLFTVVSQDENLFLKYRGTLENFALHSIMMYKPNRNYLSSSLINCLIVLPERERFIVKSIVYNAIVVQCSHKWLVNADKTPVLESLTNQNFAELWSAVLFPQYSPRSSSSEITNYLFDVFMESIFKVIETLDFASINDCTSVDSGQSDVTLFENLVSLIGNSFSNHTSRKFEDWSSFFLKKNIEYSIRFPRICGFHKLIAIWLRLSKHFLNTEISLVEECSGGISLQDYFDFVIDNILGYKGELFHACMGVITLASAISRHSISKLIVPFQIWLSVMHNSPELAAESVGAVYNWLIHHGHESMDNFLNAILPFLRPLLKFCLGKNPKKNSLETELLKLMACPTTEQCNSLLLRPAQSITLKTTLIDLEFDFIRTRLQLRFEDLINPVILLASEYHTNSDMMEARYLMAIIPLIIIDAGSRSSNFEEIVICFGQIIPVILDLACESQNGSFFKKLIFQLIHLTVKNPSFRDFNYSLMNSVVEKLLASKNPGVVELGLSVVHSNTILLKQSGMDSHYDSAIEMILSTVENNLLNDDYLRRRGACQIFNTLADFIFYKIYFVEKYSLRMVCAFITSLSVFRYEIDEMSVSTSKLKTIICDNIFRLQNVNVEMSPGMPSLQYIENFLLKHCLSKNLQCSRESQSFLLPLLIAKNEKKARSGDLNKRLLESDSSLQESCNKLQTNVNDSTIIDWHHSLLASFNYYSWTIRNKITDSPELSLSGIVERVINFVDYTRQMPVETVMLKVLRKNTIVSIFGLLKLLASSKDNELLGELCRINKFLDFFVKLLVQPSQLRVTFLKKEHTLFIESHLLPLFDAMEWSRREDLNARLQSLVAATVDGLEVDRCHFTSDQLEIMDRILVVSKFPNMKIFVEKWHPTLDKVQVVWNLNSENKKAILHDKLKIHGIACLIQLSALSDKLIVDHLWEFLRSSPERTQTIDYSLLRTFEETVLHVLVLFPEKTSALLTSIIRKEENIEEIVYFVQFILAHASSKDSSTSLCICKSVEKALNDCHNDLIVWCKDSPDRTVYLVETLYILFRSLKRRQFVTQTPYESWLKNTFSKLSSSTDSHLVFKCYPYFSNIFDVSNSEIAIEPGTSNDDALRWAKDGLNLGLVVMKDENLIPFVLKNMFISVEELCELIDVIKMLPSVGERMLLTILNEAWKHSTEGANAPFKMEPIELVKTFVIPLIFQLSLSSLNAFFGGVIEEIHSAVNVPVVPAAPLDIFRVQIIKNTISFMLIEVMLDLIPPDVLFGDSSFLTKLSVPLKSYKRIVLEKAHAVLTMPGSIDQSLRDLWRSLNCFALNVIVVILKKRGANDEMMDKFIFRDTSIHEGRFCRITSTTNYALSSYDGVSNQLSEKKVVLTSQKYRKIAVSQSLDLTPSIATQECKLFDFVGLKAITAMECENSSTEMFLTKDDIDSHESMIPVCQLILQAISNVPTTEHNVFPKWMESLRNSLMNSKASQNSRVFILRVVYNCRKAFKQYASHWIGPILLCMSLPPFKDGRSHFFVQLVLMLTVSWKETCSPNSDRNIALKYANRLLKTVVKNCESSNQTWSSASLKILRKLIDVWGMHLTVPYDLLTEMLGKGNHMTLKVCSVLCEKKIAPFDVARLNLENGFLNYLIQLWKASGNSKESLKTSSQLLGYVLWSLKESEIPENIVKERTILDHVFKHLSAMRMNDVQYILYIQKYYPSISKDFVSKFIAYLSNIKKASLHLPVLEIIDVHLSQNRDVGIYEQLQDTIPFSSTSDKVKIPRIVLNIHGHFVESRLEVALTRSILVNISRFIDSKDVEHQETAIQILISHYWNIKKNHGLSSPELLNDIEYTLLRHMFSTKFGGKNEKVTRFFTDVKFQSFASPASALTFLFKQKDIFDDQNALQILVILFIQFFDRSFDKAKPLFLSPVFSQLNVQELPQENFHFWRKAPNYVETFTSVPSSQMKPSDIDVTEFLGAERQFWRTNPSKPSNALRPYHEATYHDLVSSVVSLALKEDLVAGIMFKHFMNGLLRQLESSERVKLSLHVKQLFADVEIKSASLVSALLELLFMNDMPCRVSNLASVCWRMNTPEIGILLSERDTLLAPNEPISGKKNCESAESFPLFQFLMLYTNLNESDIVDGTFQRLLEFNVNPNDPHLKTVEYTKIARSLGDWNFLNEKLKPEVSASNLDVKSPMHAMLDSFVISEAYSCLSSPQRRECILQDWALNTEQRIKIESYYPHLSIIFNSNGSNYEKSREHIEKTLSSSMSYATIRGQQCVHRPTQLNLKILLDLFMFSISDVEECVKYWPLIQMLSSDKVCLSDSLHLTDFYQCFRCHLLDECCSVLKEDRENGIVTVENMKTDMIFSIIDASLAHSNVESANKMSERVLTKKRSLEDSSCDLFSFYLSKISFVKYQQTNSIHDLHKAWKSIRPVLRSPPTSLLLSHVSKLCKSYAGCCTEAPADVWNLKKWINEQPFSSQLPNQRQDLLYLGLNCLMSAVDLPDCGENAALVELASFCEHILSSGGGEESSKIKLSETLITSVLRSMAQGNKNARMMFLSSLRAFSELSLGETLEKESSQVPAWMFLEWLPQLLASFNSPNGSALVPLLYRTFRSFPEQCTLSFELFLESHRASLLNFHENANIDKLKSCLHTENYGSNKSFFDSVALVRNPRLFLNHHIKLIMNSSEANTNRLAKDMFRQCFEKNNVALGRAYRENDEFFDRIVEALDLRNKNKMEGTRKLEEISEQLIEKSTSVSKFNLLEDYSPQLAALVSTVGNIQIPDSTAIHFSNFSRPTVSVVKFDPKVEMMSSLRKPIKMSFIGSDGNRHFLLVKSGEDLRQDHLCQQCFQIFNSAFSLNIPSLNFKIRTYNVIPIAPEVGLIEWIDNTSTISSIINRGLSKEHLELRNQLRQKHAEEILKLAEKRKEDQGITSQEYLREIELLQKELEPLSSRLPPKLLVKSIYRLSSSPTDFYNIRIRFMRSYAALCGSHWVIGVNDRHLSNCLIDLENGDVIGIDFGQTFGARLQQGFFAELAPFRMTPCFYHVYGPFYVDGILLSSIRDVLKGIRAFEKTLVNALEVCRQDPTDHIKSLAQRFYKDQDESNALASYYSSIVDIIRLKLDPNEQPLNIIKTQLKMGHQNGAEHFHSDLLANVDQSADNVKNLLSIARNEKILAACPYSYEPWL